MHYSVLGGTLNSKKHTYNGLGNETAYRPSQPYKTSKLLGQSQREQERRSITCAMLAFVGGYLMSATYPSSTVQAIWAPAMEILSFTRSKVDILRRDKSGVLSFWVPLARSLPVEGSGSVSDLSRSRESDILTRFACLDGQGIWVVGSGSAATPAGKVMAAQTENAGVGDAGVCGLYVGDVPRTGE